MKQTGATNNAGKPKPYIIKPAEVYAPSGKGGCKDEESEQQK